MTTATATPGMVAWPRARDLAYAAAVPLASEQVPIEAATGRVLAMPLVVARPMPAFDVAAMDGYAVAGDGPWQVVDEDGARPGRPWAGSLDPGRAVPVATGAAVPAGTTRVLPIEVCLLRGSGLHATGLPAKPHIRRAGEDARPGEVLLTAGSRAGAAAVGLAASLGLDRVSVVRRPRVAVVVTGDELVVEGVPETGLVRDAIGPMLPGLVSGWGGLLATVARVGDGTDLPLAQDAEVVVVTGSTSVGTTDRLRSGLAPETRVVDGVACHPGHPMLLARHDGRLVVGLPGNPFAAFVAAHTLLAPVLARLAGAPAPAVTRARLRGEVSGRGTQVVPVRTTGTGEVTVIQGRGSAYLGAVAAADALAVVEPGEGLATVVTLGV